MYERVWKRLLDILLSLLALVILSPLLLILTIIGAIAMKGNPFFVQPRPGKKDALGHERIFKLIKLRTMSNARDASGELLPDEQRLNAYGKFLRSTSADELPSLINMIRGDLSICGPRPQLVRDMVFMTEEQRRRHSVRPGLTGLAQINGRNSITWEQKLSFDLDYIDSGLTFREDLRIVLVTAMRVLRRHGITADGQATAEDYGDYLLRCGAISQEEYDMGQAEAKRMLAQNTTAIASELMTTG